MREEPNVKGLFDLEGRTALVTGACGYLGQSIAASLAELGARVIVSSQSLEKATDFCKKLPAPNEQNHQGVQIDQLDEASIEKGFKTVVKTVGSVNILVNNAHEVLTKDWTDVTGEEFTCHMKNVTGYFLLARHVRNLAVKMKHQASIIMLGSMYGVTGSYPEAFVGRTASPVAYHAVKGAVIQMTRHLAVYWASDGVRVNCLSPGSFPNLGIPEEKLKPSPWNPMKRIGQPRELKGAVAFLASDASSYVTGHNLLIDGGWTAW